MKFCFKDTQTNGSAFYAVDGHSQPRHVCLSSASLSAGFALTRTTEVSFLCSLGGREICICKLKHVCVPRLTRECLPLRRRGSWKRGRAGRREWHV